MNSQLIFQKRYNTCLGIHINFFFIFIHVIDILIFREKLKIDFLQIFERQRIML